MSDVAATNVTIVKSWTEGDLHSKRFICKLVSVEITAAGSGAEGAKIPASAFGFSKVEQVSNVVKSDDSVIYAGSPNVDLDEVLIGGVADGIPVAVTGTFQFVVKGQNA
jgi:hypothetical protein